MFEHFLPATSSNIGTFKHWPIRLYGQCLNSGTLKHQPYMNVPMFDPPIQTSVLQTSAAEGSRGKSFSGWQGADEYVRLYALNLPALMNLTLTGTSNRFLHISRSSLGWCSKQMTSLRSESMVGRREDPCKK